MIERLFFALWPNDNIRQHLGNISQQVTPEASGKVVSIDNLHITLVFVGEVNPPTKQCLQEVATTVQGHHFTLTLDTLDYWPKNQVLWFGASQIPTALQTLVTDLNTGLPKCGYRPETRPYQAHLTLMRKAKLTKPLPTIPPFSWPVEDFCLVRSKTKPTGTQYEVIARWPLLAESGV
jgi:2'-5' RNA ligase